LLRLPKGQEGARCCQKAKKELAAAKRPRRSLLLPELVVAEELLPRRLPRSPRMIEVCCLVKKWDRVAQAQFLHIAYT
jgi:hypothetical protein